MPNKIYQKLTMSNAKIQKIQALREALRRLVNYNDSDPDLYEGDDDGVLGRLMYEAEKALKNTKDDELFPDA